MFNNIDNTNYKIKPSARAHLCKLKFAHSPRATPLDPLLRKQKNYCSNNFLKSTHITLGAN